jgi:hypothetical protein
MKHAGLRARSQFISGSSCDRPTRSRFSVVFLCPRANAELVPKFHVALHASRAALPMVTSKFRPNVALPMLDQNGTMMHPFQHDIKLIPIIRSQTSAQLLSFRFHTYSLPKASPSLKHTSTRRTSGHRLGTSKPAKKVFLPPPPSLNVMSLATSHPLSLLSLSLSLYPPIDVGQQIGNTFPRLRRIVGDVVFYAVHVVSKESRRLVLPRISCCKIN